MRQYRDAKSAYPDAILFFRLGDFYEMFNDDAVVAARELGLTLTSRNKGAAAEVPMAGVPHHAAHNYLVKLIAAGHKVAICEQMGDPSKLKGLVPRQVVRVLTPGLLTDSDQLDARQNNYLCAIDGGESNECCGLALLDLSTAEMSACAVSGRALLVAEIARAEPREILLPAGLDELRGAIALAAPRSAIRSDAALSDDVLRQHLDDQVATPLYDDAHRDHGAEAVRAAARALRFATHYLPSMTLPVRRIARLDLDACMGIDETARSHLELVQGVEGGRRGSLLDTIDTTITAPGARLLRRQLLAPLVDVTTIRRRLDAVELFVQNPRARDELRTALGPMGDVERLAVRATLHESPPRELGALRASLAAAPQALAAIQSIPGVTGAEGASAGAALALDLDVDLLEPLHELLSTALVDELPARVSDGGIVREGHDAELDELASLRRGGKELLAALEARLREETAIPSLKIKYTRAFGWYIEVTRAHIDKAPERWRRRQTLTNAERYLDDELEELADRLMGAEERHAEREATLFDELVTQVATYAEPLRRLARAISQWDNAAALAEVAHRHDFTRPQVDDGDHIHLKDARHPVVEHFVPTGQFVPNDTDLDLGGERLWLVTGPNMAGKSTLMRQVALITILAQMGSFVPAREAQIGVVDRVLSRVGASDNLARGESTFMVEMRETAAILRNATRRSLVILDEIGRGTSTYDGLAIAWTVTEHLYETVRCRAMFATHYHQLTELGEQHEGIANYSVSAREHDGDIVFLHRLTRGAVNRSYGIAVARLAGLPEAVLCRASAILESLEGAAPITGGPGSVRTEPADPQLDLFRRPTEPTAEQTVTRQLKHLSTDRMTPLEALQLLDKLKQTLDED
ncbi:MAG: DNA mismatch repair protein MutS [Deltaproteobacteria bacterium]|nr:DNA mismatch repair protein MutS [Deltaproteobacteria bacterium]